MNSLTSGETALIQRRRWGVNRDQMAKLMGVSRRTYFRIEHDVISSEPFDLTELHAHEKCIIHRRRAGMTQEKVAREMGVTRVWVNRMESGVVSCDSLILYWCSQLRFSDFILGRVI